MRASVMADSWVRAVRGAARDAAAIAARKRPRIPERILNVVVVMRR